MSDDGFSDCFEEPNMEIQIKTLMGTTFDIKVSSSDTIGDIKRKIYRVEGIPIHQQNLIFGVTLLQDTIRLCDSGIRNGSTLILVSQMRGGPIATKRLSFTCDHFLLKELRDLLNRDELNPGSKVSVLVFKEGDMINLLRVIENEDGSYSPYSENTISPPSKSSRRDALETFQRLVEDTEMCTKIADVRKKIQERNNRRQIRNKMQEELDQKENNTENLQKTDANEKGFSYKFLEDCAPGLINNMDLTIFERSADEGNQSESEEIALKDKHRTKPKILQNLLVSKTNTKSLYNERKGSYSHTRQNYARMAKRRDSSKFADKIDKTSNTYTLYSKEKNTTNDEWETSNIINNNTSVNKVSNNLITSRILEDSLSSNVDGLDRVSVTSKNTENSYLLEGLNSNKLPDLDILEKNDFLMGSFISTEETTQPLGHNLEDISDVLENNTFLKLPSSNQLDSSYNISSSIVLPDITSRLDNRSLGPLIPDITSSNLAHSIALENKITKSAIVADKSHLSNYSLPNTSRLFHSNSLESKIFPSLAPSNLANKVPQSNTHPLTSMNMSKLSHTTNTLETSLPNLTRLETTRGNISSSRGESPVLGVNETTVEEMSTKLADQLHFLDDDPNSDIYGESISVSARNRVHLTRLVLSSDGAERPKSSPNSIELEERGQEFWEIHEPASERLKHSATCKVGLVKRRQGLEYNYDSLENPQPNLNSDLGKYSKTSAEYGVCSGTNFYVPQCLSTPSAIPPQYAPKQQPNFCDLYFTSERRSPLYSRRNRKENLEDVETKQDKYNNTSANFLGDCSRIQRLKNDDSFCKPKEDLIHDLFEHHRNLNSGLFQKEESKKEEVKLPPVIKKKSRCSECNKKLNITNIYNCRCGRIFCAQHRYSEVHRCTYDYKTEGRKILERQNPLVTAEKVKRF